MALIEVGTGEKMDAKSRDIFALEDRWVGDALAEVGTALFSERSSPEQTRLNANG